MNAARMLRQARRHAGISQRELAARTGMLQPQIARIERGAVSPRLSTMERLLTVTGATLELGPSIGIGVDRSLIRVALEKSPEERLIAAGTAARNLAAFQRATQRGQRH